MKWLSIIGFYVFIMTCVLTMAVLISFQIKHGDFAYMYGDPRQKRNDSHVLFDPIDGSAFKLRIIVLTYNRHQALKQCLSSLEEADYDGDEVDLDVWIDRNKLNVTDAKTHNTASTFRWSHGKFTVHVHSWHVGIYGQWLNTWHVDDEKQNENAFFLEDDIVVSRSFYVWIKTMHMHYSTRSDLSGFALQGKILTMGGQRAGSLLQIPKHHPLYLYRIFGTWGFSPVRRVWVDFISWYNTASQNKTFKPYVPDILPTAWYKSFELSHKADGMWSIWFLYYTHIKGLYCLYPNLAKNALVINMELPGIHYKSAGQTILTKHLTDHLNITAMKLPVNPLKVNYDGTYV